MKKFFAPLIFLTFLQGLIGVSLFGTYAVDFLDGKGPQDARHLRRDIKIPIGFTGDSTHYITLLKGTLLSEIPLKISQKREELGLSFDIPLDQQNEFFQNLIWKTPKAIFIKSPLPGRVVQMTVQPGQPILVSDRVCTIECMKMYCDIRAQADGGIGNAPGEIRDVFFKAGDIVDQESDLISYVPPDPDWEDVDQAKILDNKDLLALLFTWEARAPVAPPKVSPPNRVWKEMRHSEFLENKDFMILLYPWMAGSPPTTPSAPPPLKGSKNNVLHTRLDHGNTQRMPTPSEVHLPKAPNSALDTSDQKLRKDNTKTTHEKAEKHLSVWQDKKVSFGMKEMPNNEIKEASGISTFTWATWVCGLVVLSKLAFAIKSIGYKILRRSRIGKSAFMISLFPRTVHLHALDFNNHRLVKNSIAQNMNRPYFVRWRFARC